MRIVICDDNEINSNQLRKLIITYFHQLNFHLPDFAIFNCGEDLLADEGNQDIVFLDIEMPGINGIYVGNELKKRNKNAIIIIVTSFLEYLDDAMRFQVFRYLTKPIDKNRLFSNLDDALKLYSSISLNIPIETKDGIVSVNAVDIIMVETTGRKANIYTTVGKYLSTNNINYWRNHLPSQNFYQSHRSYIVNLFHINEFDHSTILLFNKSYSAYLTRRKYTEFKDVYLLFLESTR